ncbi:hypothetical protein GCM10027592_15280 [Spirosoma flavus]
MILLPYERITYRTRLCESEIITRLLDSVEPKRTFRFELLWSSSEKPYQGEIVGNQFTITRIIRYRNSFLPQISGVIQSGFQETTVQVKMGLHPFVIVFLCGWVGFISMFLTGIWANLFRSENHFNPIALLPLGMIVFAYAITMAGFKYESNRSRKDLLELFEAEIVTKETP